MSSLEIVLLVLVIVVVVVLAISLVILIPRLSKGKSESAPTESKSSDDKLIQMMNSTLDSLNKKMDDYNQKTEKAIGDVNTAFEKKIGEVNVAIEKTMNDTSSSFDKKINEVNESLTKKMGEVNVSLENIKTTQKSLDDMSKDMTDLKTVITGNQSRGQYGEMQLSIILQQHFKEQSDSTYREQYKIKEGKDGEDIRPDAVVFLPNDLYICVDSKFPFRDYEVLLGEDIEKRETAQKEFKKAVKTHIDTISEKYIIDGVTFPYAIMFIPSDSIDSYIHTELPEVVDYAYDKNVILTSPRVLGPLLMEIRMLKQEEERNKLAREITSEINALGKQFNLFSDEWSKFSNRVKGLNKDVDALDKRTERITSRFDKIKNNDVLTIENSENPKLDVIPNEEDTSEE